MMCMTTFTSFMTLLFQLSSGCKFPVLEQEQGERALLLKDYHGDWGILIGKWEGFRKGMPGTPGE